MIPHSSSRISHPQPPRQWDGHLSRALLNRSWQISLHKKRPTFSCPIFRAHTMSPSNTTTSTTPLHILLPVCTPSVHISTSYRFIGCEMICGSMTAMSMPINRRLLLRLVCSGHGGCRRGVGGKILLAHLTSMRGLRSRGLSSCRIRQKRAASCLQSTPHQLCP